MIPSDVAAQLRPIIPDATSANKAQTQPVAGAQRINDALSNLVPGQRILAEIQALLPNGTYRAIVSQREITLALPFSAKPGDSLELEVTENNGKIALAFVANKTDSQASTQQNNSAATSLSPTGKLIGDLLSSIGQEGKRPPPVMLNGNQALIAASPEDTAQLASTLKQAVTQSGVFYEAHQARWVAGELPTESLRQEPQGKLPAGHAQEQSALVKPTDAQQLSPRTALESNSGNTASPPATTPAQSASSTHIPREITPVVQQQLEALANQQVVMHAQAWPGQQMEWEIDHNGHQENTPENRDAAPWQTRLRLDLPSLGQIDALIRQGNASGISIRLLTHSDAGEEKLRQATENLRLQYEAAGLSLAEVLIQHDQAAS